MHNFNVNMIIFISLFKDTIYSPPNPAWGGLFVFSKVLSFLLSLPRPKSSRYYSTLKHLMKWWSSYENMTVIISEDRTLRTHCTTRFYQTRFRGCSKMTSSILGGYLDPPPLPLVITSSSGYPPPLCRRKWWEELICDKTVYAGLLMIIFSAQLLFLCLGLIWPMI